MRRKRFGTSARQSEPFRTGPQSICPPYKSKPPQGLRRNPVQKRPPNGIILRFGTVLQNSPHRNQSDSGEIPERQSRIIRRNRLFPSDHQTAHRSTLRNSSQKRNNEHHFPQKPPQTSRRVPTLQRSRTTASVLQIPPVPYPAKQSLRVPIRHPEALHRMRRIS